MRDPSKTRKPKLLQSDTCSHIEPDCRDQAKCLFVEDERQVIQECGKPSFRLSTGCEFKLQCCARSNKAAHKPASEFNEHFIRDGGHRAQFDIVHSDDDSVVYIFPNPVEHDVELELRRVLGYPQWCVSKSRVRG